MCGIAGIWHLDKKPLEEGKLKKFTDSMYHRGPDGSGYHVFNDVQLGFGHRRLSILDLSDAGKQPMSFADGRYWITYNGEVYNFLELKTELEKLGYSFQTHSDTEIILAAYHKWGKDCMKRFNGMWAIAIYDTKEQTLFLSRDRFGVKPLHYLFIPGKLFAFASETYAFNHLEDFKRTFNNTTLSHSIYSFSSIEPWGYTLFNNIFQLLPGHYIELKIGRELKQKKWWDTFENLQEAPAKYEEQVDKFRELFMDACKLRLRSDVSVASALSGGVDSSSVYCMLHYMMKNSADSRRVPSDWQKAFVATFPGTAVDERHYAEQVVKFTNGNANYITPDYSNLVSDIKKATLLFDGIAATPITAVTDIYKAMRKNGITVSLDGHGVDEMIFGYNASAAEAYLSAKLSGDETYASDLLETCLAMQPAENSEAIKSRLANRYKTIKEFDAKINSQNPLKKFAKKVLKNVIKEPKALNELNNIEWLKGTINSLPYISEQHYQFHNLSRAESHLAHDFHINSIPYNLRDFDRGAMQHSIEIRMPFMDYRLVTYLFSLETKSKIGGGFTKRILRDSMKGIMPESIRTRKLKIGLGAPMTDWFSNELANFIKDEVSSEKFLKCEIWNGPVIRDFALSRIKNKNWTMPECSRFWQVFNAHLLLTN